MTIEKIIRIKMIVHDEEMLDADSSDLSEFIAAVLNDEFSKDALEFEVVR